MSDSNQLQMMVKTHNILSSLLFEYLVKYGQSMGKAMNSLPETQELKGSDSEEIDLPTETQNKIDEATLNMLCLISSEDEECLKSVNSYIKLFKEIADTFPKHKRKEMPEGTRRIFDSLWQKQPSKPSMYRTMTNFSNTLDSFYCLAE